MIRREIVTLVARREIGERARTRAFALSTVFLLLVVGGLTVLSTTAGGGSSATIGAAGAGAAALAQSAAPRATQAGLRLHVKRYRDVAAARDAVRAGDLGAALVVEPSGAHIVAGKDASRTAVTLLQGVLAARQTLTRLTAYGVPESVAVEALAAQGPRIDVITPPRNATSRGIAYLASLLLYLAILTYGLFIAAGIVTEKATRVVEVILSAVRPVELLAGKIAGLALLSLGQFSLVALVALATAQVAGVDLPVGAPLAIALAVLFSLLGYLLYACAFAVAGSIVSRQEDLQSSSAPLTLILVGGFILTQTALNDPHGTLATVLSILPLTAPLAMPSRVALADVPPWEIAFSAALTLTSALLVLRLAATVYSATVLRMGQRLPLREALHLRRRSV